MFSKVSHRYNILGSHVAGGLVTISTLDTKVTKTKLFNRIFYQILLETWLKRIETRFVD